MNLNLFEFDYDLTWMAFFLNADETIYGRYGGRDASGPDTRNTLGGLHFALEQALKAHERYQAQPAPQKVALFRAEDFPETKLLQRNNCIHCHQLKEFRRADLKAKGTWTRDELWTYPLPENVGITLDKAQGNLIKAVQPKSPADSVGLKAGDRLEKLNGVSVASFADVQYGLHKAPKAGQIALSWLRDGKSTSATMAVADGWRKTNITWRPSLLDILPSLPVSGDDLSANEKKTLGISEGRAAFRQDKFVHSSLKKVGLQQGDVIIAVDGRAVEGTMEDLVGHVRKNYLVGDKVTLNVLRDGKPVDIAIELK
jgi:serine protease Do